jgi:hypothetical protein
MYEEAEAVLDGLVGRTAELMSTQRELGMSADEALSALVGSFLSVAATKESAAAGAVHYALALHRLVADRTLIAALEDRVAMLEQLDALREL